MNKYKELKLMIYEAAEDDNRVLELFNLMIASSNKIKELEKSGASKEDIQKEKDHLKKLTKEREENIKKFGSSSQIALKNAIKNLHDKGYDI